MQPHSSKNHQGKIHPTLCRGQHSRTGPICGSHSPSSERARSAQGAPPPPALASLLAGCPNPGCISTFTHPSPEARRKPFLHQHPNKHRTAVTAYFTPSKFYTIYCGKSRRASMSSIWRAQNPFHIPTATSRPLPPLAQQFGRNDAG